MTPTEASFFITQNYIYRIPCGFPPLLSISAPAVPHAWDADSDSTRFDSHTADAYSDSARFDSHTADANSDSAKFDSHTVDADSDSRHRLHSCMFCTEFLIKFQRIPSHIMRRHHRFQIYLLDSALSVLRKKNIKIF